MRLQYDYEYRWRFCISWRKLHIKKLGAFHPRHIEITQDDKKSGQKFYTQCFEKRMVQCMWKKKGIFCFHCSEILNHECLNKRPKFTTFLILACGGTCRVYWSTEFWNVLQIFVGFLMTTAEVRSFQLVLLLFITLYSLLKEVVYVDLPVIWHDCKSCCKF